MPGGQQGHSTYKRRVPKGSTGVRCSWIGNDSKAVQLAMSHAEKGVGKKKALERKRLTLF